MYRKVYSTALKGINGYLVEVEVDVSEGFPRFDLVGLPDSAVKESIERVRTSIKNSGFQFPYKRITVNLAPANQRKGGPLYDLPIAIGILACTDIVDEKSLYDTIILGELSLNGDIKKVNGILPMIYHSFKKGYLRCIVPKENVYEAAVVEGIEIIGVSNLKEVIGLLNTDSTITPTTINIEKLFKKDKNKHSTLDFSDICGQENAKRAMEVAVAGLHNILLIGVPGSGKTMLAKRVPTILPILSFEESMDITKIYSVAGMLKKRESLITKRPFRSPHHTISTTALTGGGILPQPGEVSLAHKGVLFLDELPEFKKNVLEILRQPLEDGEITISRLQGTYTYPSDFMLVCSMNPCPCGYFPHFDQCTCTPLQIKRYLNRVSGPLLDRIDVQVEVAKVDFKNLSDSIVKEESKIIQQRVQQALNIQKERYKKIGKLFNSNLTATEIKKYCVVEKEGERLVREAFEKLNLSARAYHRILKVGRTIADLDGNTVIRDYHVAEAIQYRTLDRKYWGNI